MGNTNTNTINVSDVYLHQLPDMLMDFYKARIPVLLMGTPGIGKSSVIEQFANKMRETDPDFGYVDKRIASSDPGDIVGRQFYDANIQSLLHIAPEEWPTDGNGVLVLEELADGTRLQTSAVYSILQERRIGQKELPEGWWVVGCCNRPDDGSNARQLTTALADRVAVFNVVADLKSFTDHAIRQEINPKILAFLRLNPQYLDGNEHQIETGELVSPTPRSWFQVDQIMSMGSFANTDLRRSLLASKIGISVATTFLGFMAQDCEDVPVDKLMAAKTKREIEDLLPTDVSKLAYLVFAMVAMCKGTNKPFFQAFLILEVLKDRASTSNRRTGNVGEIIAYAVESLLIKYVSSDIEDRLDNINVFLTPFEEMLS